VSDDSVTVWLRRIKEGNQEAARLLWNRYSSALHRLARNRYPQALNAVANEEDLVQSVFRALWSGAAVGRWDAVQNRTELWWLLLAITRHKALKRQTYNTRLKRNEPTVSFHEQGPSTPGGDEGPPLDVAGDEPPPELILLLQEEQDRLLTTLRDDVLRSIAVWKLEGYTHAQIAGKLGVTPRTVIRKLNLIREVWSQELAS
jgi:DNA-directed RNA polymerase specialized sigma24 family protein